MIRPLRIPPRHVAPPPDDDDFDAADMGTAFGMECSLAPERPAPATKPGWPGIDEIDPPESVADAVEDLVRCTLLLADVTRPRAAAAPARRPARGAGRRPPRR